MRSNLENLLLGLWERGAIKIDTRVGFKMKIHETNPGAPLSPIYLNLRTPDNPKPGPLTPEDVGLIGSILFQRVAHDLTFYQGVAGLPRAGDPIAEAFVEAAKKRGHSVPLLRLSKVEAEGKRRIDSVTDMAGLTPGAIVLGIDDLATHGASKDEAIQALKKAEMRINTMLVLVDRGQGASQHLAQQRVTLHAIVDIVGVLNFYRSRGLMTEHDHGVVKKYLGFA